ncbi:MAG: hypothetical protein ACYCZZ_01955 [Minisyncoccota bacterium]
MNTKRVVVAIFIVATGTGVYVFFGGYHLNDNNAPQPAANTSPSQSIDQDQYVGEISTTTSGQNIYTNTKYGFQFIYPQGWRVGDNHLGYGTFQLFNYPDTEPGASSKGFAKNENKIEAAVGNISINSAMSSPPNSNYATSSSELVSLGSAGQNILRTDAELFGGEKFRTYLLPLKNMPNESLQISIYGDPSNFYVLDNLVKSIVWK